MNHMKCKVVALIFIISASAAGVLSQGDNSTVFRKKCSACHELKNPAAYSSEQWTYHVKRMADRAGLNASEIDQIIKLR